MKNSHRHLDRLFQDAARATPRDEASPSFALESRVLANWRPAAQAGDLEILVRWLRRATIAACFLAFLSIAWQFDSPHLSSPGTGEFAVADSAMSIGVEP